MRKGREILHLTAMRSTKYGSLEQYFVALAKGVEGRGWRLALQYNEPPRSARYLGDLREAGAVVVVRRLDHGRIAAAVQALLLIARRRPAVVHLHFCGSLTILAVGLLARVLGVALTVASVHSIITPRSRALVRAGYARIDQILCVSEAANRTMVELGIPETKMTTRYLGVPDVGSVHAGAREDVRKELAIPPGADVLGTIVFNNPVKGADVLIDAFVNHLLPRYPDLHLVIVGISPKDAALVWPSWDLVTAGRLHWAGVQDDVRPFLAATDIYVQPSRIEGLALAILEAMREGLPVVASKVGGIPEAVADGESGLLVQPGAPEELALAISRLLDDRALAGRLGAAGFDRWRDRFVRSTSVEDSLDDYAAVLPARGAV